MDATSCSFPLNILNPSHLTKIQRCIWIAQTYPSIRPPNDLTDCYCIYDSPFAELSPLSSPQNYIFVPTTGLAHPTFSTLPDFRWENNPLPLAPFKVVPNLIFLHWLDSEADVDLEVLQFPHPEAGQKSRAWRLKMGFVQW